MKKMDIDLKIIYGLWVFIIASSVIFLPLISASPDLTDGLVGVYQFENSGNDSLGLYNGTSEGTPTYRTGVHGLEYVTDGNDWYNISAKPLLVDTPKTISAWVNISDYTNRGVIYGTRQLTADGWQALIWENNGKVWYANIGDGNAFSNDTIVANTRYHLAWVYANITYVKLYINGVDAGISANTLTPPDESATGKTWIGRSSASYHKGSIDELYVWNRTLSSSEIETLAVGDAGSFYPFVVDTCTCAGAGNNWEIDMSDYCNITEACDLTTGHLNFTGAGWCKCNASVDTTNLGDPGASGILYIQDSCTIWVSG